MPAPSSNPLPYPMRLSAELGSVANALAVVKGLREQHALNPELRALVLAVKRVQCERFRRSYADVLSNPDWGDAARFFLYELYSDQDFSERDHQFGRIAPTVERLFPSAVSGVATALVHLHAISEQLDHSMALAIQAISPDTQDDSSVRASYVSAWRQIGLQDARSEQLTLFVRLGAELDKLTRIPSLRMMLRMMRVPATAAGLQQLQSFLELGFDTFKAMQRSKAGASAFLELIKTRESAWIARLYDASVTTTTSGGAWPELE
jgi:hypothetical protein